MKKPFWMYLRSHLRLSLGLSLLLTIFSCQSRNGATAQTPATTQTAETKKDGTLAISDTDLDQRYAELGKAYFASGCFWCTEAVFERIEGVKDVQSGYTGGPEPKPTYEEVSAGSTRHAEAVVVYYDSSQVSYRQLVEAFFASHDPTQVDRQGPDVGPQYRSGIFYLNEEQRAVAEDYKEKLNKSGKYDKPIATEITAAGPFYIAEDYHQDYYEQHPENPYIQNVSRPKVEKFVKEYKAWLKEEYQ